MLLFACHRWENCIVGCNSVPIWRFHVYIRLSMDSCIESKRWRNSSWFHFCNIHVVINVGKLFCITVDGPFYESWELHADCFYHLCCRSHTPNHHQCMFCFSLKSFCFSLLPPLSGVLLFLCELAFLTLSYYSGHMSKQYLIAPRKEKSGGISFAHCIQLLGFCTFEACVGIFWPSIMKMRSQYIPEEARSTIMNFFRIPLNIFVCIVLYNVSKLGSRILFFWAERFSVNSNMINDVDISMFGGCCNWSVVYLFFFWLEWGEEMFWTV